MAFFFVFQQIENKKVDRIRERADLNHTLEKKTYRS